MSLHPAIYLDYNATTPVAPEVVNEMLPYFLSAYGNPSSSDHIIGWQAKEAVETARKSIAGVLNLRSEGIIFTSGATEAINMALKGFFLNNKEPQHLITLKTEHKAVIETCRYLEDNGVKVTYLPVCEDGLVDLVSLSESITDSTRMVCIMMVNNETGILQPIDEIIEICHSQEVLFLSDTTQAVGKLGFGTLTSKIDLMVGSAHKFYGPMGVGFLYLRGNLKTQIQPLLTGGKQEGNRRAGTINVPGIVGMAKALEFVTNSLLEDRARIKQLKDRFEDKLKSVLAIKIIGKDSPRVYTTSSVIFHGVDAEKLMQALGSKLSASRGSACTSTRIEPSHVLMGMGLSEDYALATIRFSLGIYTTSDEIDRACELIIEAVNRLIITS